jgi:O-succinylbenzoic acid--CoA ligase
MIITCPLHAAAQTWPDAVVCYEDGARFTFDEWESVVNNHTGRLKRLGIGVGDRVAILARNSPDYVAVLLALPRIGAVAVPLNLRWSRTDWQSLVERTQAKLLLTDTDHSAEISRQNFQSYFIGDDKHKESLFHIAPTGGLVAPTVDTEQEVTIMFTSGSSGIPKGVILTYGNHYFNACGSNENITLAPGDCWLLSLPLHHVGGIAILYRCLLAGAAIRFVERFEAAQSNVLIDSGRVTHLSLVPAMLGELLRQRDQRPTPRTLKAILLSGAPVPSQVTVLARQMGLPLLTSYGLTETASQVCTLSPFDTSDKLLTVGRPLPYRELRVVDDSGRSTPANGEGEIAVRGEVVFKGYLDERDSAFDADGWFRTGDVGYLDEDGYLVVCGRKDDMLISGGENIHPQEIEAVAQSYPGVNGVAVIAVLDHEWGERPVLFVETISPASFDVDSLEQYLEARLARLKLPKEVIVLDKLPRTAIGKIEKTDLEELYRRRSANQGAD